MAHDHDRLHALATLFWAACGVVALVAIVLGAVLDVDPAEAELATAAVLLAATLWLVHEWRMLWRSDRGVDEERLR